MSPPSSEPYTVGQYLADRLHELGIEHLFAIPGDYCAEWVHKYVEKNPDIERIGSTNEINAGYAADGYARMNGIGAVCVTYSVGAFSLLNPIAGAFVERVPVVAINGAPSTKKRLQFRETGFQWHHLIDDQDTDLRVYENVTCAAERIADPERAPGQIDSALRACLRESRPVYLETLEDVYDRPCDPPDAPLAVEPGQRSNPDECGKAVGAISQHLQQDDPTQPPPKELPAALTIYCDWDNTNFWKGLQAAAPDFSSPLQQKYSNQEPQRIFPASEAVVDEATELFELLYSTPDVPAPIMTSFRLWDGSSDFGYAVHQWGLGAKDDEVMQALVNPVGDIYTCGEAFSDMQGWVNGALRSADRALMALDDIPPLHEEPDVSACPAPSTSDAQTNGQSKHSVGRWGGGALLSSD